MRTFITDELRFEIPDEFRDRSLNMLATPEGKQPRISLTVSREARTEAPFAEQADLTLKEEARKFAAMKIVGRRARTAGGLEAFEARIEASANRQATYSRQVMVGYYGTLLTFTWSSLRAAREQCDRAADTMLDAITFRKR